jgi:cupin 2 domain-containing protein
MLANLFDNIPAELPDELTDVMLQTAAVRVERIVSRGHATPPGQWYDQDADEWVVLLTGGAGLRIEGRDDVLAMRPGDHVVLPAHLRHRVEWTAAGSITVWLAIHVRH